jgi:hypothetical protein
VLVRARGDLGSSFEARAVFSVVESAMADWPD